MDNVYKALDINAYACIVRFMDRLDRCLNLELRKANRVLSQIYDSYMARCGLKTSQYSILRAISFLKKTTNRQLQDVLILDQTTLTRGLKPLIRDGYISVKEGSDRRQKELFLSKEGEVLYNEAEQLWLEAQSSVEKNLGEDTKKQLLSLSKSIVGLKV
jgi:DNA-binding MarR family transcriptional regulator